METLVKLQNLHYDLTEDDIYVCIYIAGFLSFANHAHKELLSKVGPVRRVSMVFDRTGRSEGEATANFETRQDAEEAVRRFNGKRAAGLEISVSLVQNDYNFHKRIQRPDERRSRERFDRAGGSARPQRDGGRIKPPTSVRVVKKTVEELDAELTRYMNGEDTSQATQPEPAKPEASEQPAPEPVQSRVGDDDAEMVVD